VIVTDGLLMSGDRFPSLTRINSAALERASGAGGTVTLTGGDIAIRGGAAINASGNGGAQFGSGAL
jgi:hypothetical protein